MPIDDRNLGTGTRLVAHHKGKDRTCEVVQTDDGVRYRLDDGSEHRSPSGAGRAAMGGTACNGWQWWSVEGTEKPKRERQPKADKPKKEPTAKKPTRAKSPAKKPAKAKTGAKKSGTKKGKAMRAASKGDASYGCGICPETFPTMAAATDHALAHTTGD
ncbi:MAG: hypothetical protein M3P30_04770 [Chloroflexota bacterium]|nr:hypothetical protein [Chloroflexota bacterium]